MRRRVGIRALALLLAGGLSVAAGSGAPVSGPAHALASSAQSAGPVLSSAAKQGHACNLRKSTATCFSVSIAGNTGALCNLQFTGTGLMPGAPVNFEPPNMPSGSQQVLGANGPMTVPSTGVLNVASNGWNPAATDPTYVFTVQAANGTTLTSGPLTITC